MDDSLYNKQGFSDALDSLELFGQSIKIAIEPVIDAVIKFGTALWQAAWDSYLEAGACYGETQDGLSRWLHECAEIEALRTKADHIEQRHKALADSRKRL